MTVVAGMVSPSGWHYIGADTAATTDDLYSLVATPKVARFNNTLVGFAGDWRSGAKAFRLLERSTSHSLVHYFESLWRKDDYPETEFLFVEHGRIYELTQDGAILEAVKHDEGTCYGAIGTGASVALGALYVERIDLNSLLQALNASAAHSPQIRSPFLVLESEPDF